MTKNREFCMEKENIHLYSQNRGSFGIFPSPLCIEECWRFPVSCWCVLASAHNYGERMIAEYGTKVHTSVSFEEESLVLETCPWLCERRCWWEQMAQSEYGRKRNEKWLFWFFKSLFNYFSKSILICFFGK